MNKKILGIFVCITLLTTATLTIATNVIEKKTASRGWLEKQKLIPSDGSGNDRFGSAVDIATYNAIIGAYFDDSGSITNCGSAYIFTYDGSSWSQQAKLTASDADDDDEFGISVSIDGHYAIVGAHYDDANGAQSGAAYIFHRSGVTWSQQAKITPSDAAAGDQFGRSVSMDVTADGDYVIVGAPGKNSDQGFSYIFKRSDTSWIQQTKIGATNSKKLGYSVSICMPYVLMGAYGTNSNTGAAHIYELIGSSWYGKGALTASDGVSYDLFGSSVAINHDYAICGSPGHDLTYGGEGAAYIFEKPTSGWTTMTETQKITASDIASSDGFGKSVSVDGDHVIVTSPDDDDGGLASGSAYIFKRGATSWNEMAKLTASDAAAQDYLGWSASINAVDTQTYNAIVGAYADDNTNGVDAGSAYVFNWSNQAPNAPTINGPVSGKPGKSYNYKFKSTDPDGDQVYYYVKWGDGSNTGWFGPYASGVEQTKSHTWSSKGTYLIEAKAKDTYGAESGWQTLSVKIPKNKAMTIPLIKLLENHINLLPIIIRNIIQRLGL